MSRINLLPWREELKVQRQKDFISTLALAAFATLLLMLLVHTVFAGIIENQQSRNKYVVKEIKLVDKKIKTIKFLEKTKNQLLARMAIIQRLQHSRPGVVHMFDQLASTVPEGVYLNSFSQKGQKLVLKGKAQSNTRVSTYMRSLEQSPWFRAASLNIIRSQKVGVNGFTLKVAQAKAKKKKGKK